MNQEEFNKSAWLFLSQRKGNAAGGCPPVSLWNPSHNLNHMHEIEIKLTQAEKDTYGRKLQLTAEITADYDGIIDPSDIVDVAILTADERALALVEAEIIK